MTSSLYAVLLSALLSVACGPGESGETHTATQAADAGAHAGDGHDDHADQRVVLSAEQQAAAGIVLVEAGPASLREQLELSAIVAPNLDAQARVTPRISGIVHAVRVGLGEEVAAGDVLCEIDSVAFGRLASTFITARARVDIDEQILAGELAVLERHVELAQEVFDREEQLAEQGLATLSARYAAETRLQEARLKRDTRLLELEARLARDRIELVAAERELELLGVPHEELDAMAEAVGEPHAQLGRYSILAPRAGVVVARNVTDAEFVDTEHTIFTIQDLSTVWVMGAVYEQDLASVRVDAPVEVRLDAHAGVLFEGRVGLIDTSVSPTTRSASLRVVLENGPLESWPEKYPVRPGMFGVMKLTTRELDAALVVPESALVHDEAEGEAVFVAVADGEFERREVSVGVRNVDQVEILAGLELGETVAAGGTFLLKSAAGADALGGGHSH